MDKSAKAPQIVYGYILTQKEKKLNRKTREMEKKE